MPYKLLHYLKKMGFLFVALAFLLVYYFSSVHITHKRAIMYPQFFMIILGATIIWNMIDVIIKTAKELKNEEIKTKISVPEFWKEHNREIVLVLSSIVFIFASNVIGFWVSILLFMTLLSFFLGSRKLVILLPVSIGLVVVFYIVFEVLLKTRLPSGFLM